MRIDYSKVSYAFFSQTEWEWLRFGNFSSAGGRRKLRSRNFLFAAGAINAKMALGFKEESEALVRTFDTFIFDLDGTLLNTLPDLVRLTNMALAEQGFPPRSTEEVHSYIGGGVRALMRQAVPQGSSQEAIDRAFARWKVLHELYDDQLTVPYPDVPQALRALKAGGAKLAVLSNKFDEGVQQVIGRFLPGMFEVAHGEGPEIPRKPDPAGLLLTMDELGADSQRTAYIGDSPVDVVVAHRVGAFAIGVSWGYHKVDELCEADLIINDPNELVALVGLAGPVR